MNDAAVVTGKPLGHPTRLPARQAKFPTLPDLERSAGMDWGGDFQALCGVSDQNVEFWDLFWDWHGVIGDKGARKIENGTAMLARGSSPTPR